MEQLCSLWIQGEPDRFLPLWLPEPWRRARRCVQCPRRLGTAWPSDLPLCRRCVCQCGLVLWEHVAPLRRWLSLSRTDTTVQLWRRPLRVQLPFLTPKSNQPTYLLEVMADWQRGRGATAISCDFSIPGLENNWAPIVSVHVSYFYGASLKTYIWLKLESYQLAMGT